LTDWRWITVATILIFLLFHFSASLLGSQRGEWGLVVALLVVGACLIAERLLAGRNLTAACRAIGIASGTTRGLLAALMVSAILLATLPFIFAVSGASLVFLPNWGLMVPGLFLQAGVAEEALFRGFLFGSFRERFPFWQAALLSSGPFILAHLPLFAIMPWPVALASVLLALITSFPLARLFELGNRTIWAPAIVHMVIQGTVKVVALDATVMTVPLLWMAVAALVPWAAFLVRER
jgi:membrane protease YdiL (CAAX protease family)